MKNKNLRCITLSIGVLLFTTGWTWPWQKNSQDKLVDLANSLKDISWFSMIFTAIAISLVTLFGNQISEWLRGKIVRHFKIPITNQITLGIFAYALLILFSFILSYYLGAFLPVLILASATIYPFFLEYIPSLRQNDLPGRKIAMSKLKTLWLFTCVILALFIILSEPFIRTYVKL